MEKTPEWRPRAFNYAIWLYDMNADEVFDHERHLIVDSSLGLMEENGELTAPENKAPAN